MGTYTHVLEYSGGRSVVLIIVGRPHTEAELLDVAIKLPCVTEFVSRSEVFTPDEAADLFYAYYKTGDIPASYSLRPVQGFTKDGGNITIAAGDVR